MIETMTQLLREKSVCVLATVAAGRPHCSLMAYAVNDAATDMYLATLRTTRKYRNIEANPAVSLLVDTREAPQPSALTIEGACRPLAAGPERDQARVRLLGRHPDLAALLDDPGGEILKVRITSFLLLKGLTEAHRVTL